ncbi:hypothetical protein D1007_53540 [Hordeum vulgare]|nr:hypothetical protein D1007_53540 [Hordeum vulgare]
MKEMVSVGRERKDVLDSLTPGLSGWSRIHKGESTKSSWMIAGKAAKETVSDSDLMDSAGTMELPEKELDNILQGMEELGHRMLSMAYILRKSGAPGVSFHQASELLSARYKLRRNSEDFYQDTEAAESTSAEDFYPDTEGRSVESESEVEDDDDCGDDHEEIESESESDDDEEIPGEICSLTNAGRLRQEVEWLRLARNFGGAVKSCLVDRCYAESCLVGRCYARQIFRSLRIWTDERRVVAPLGAVVASMDVWTGMDDADLFPKDGSVDSSLCLTGPSRAIFAVDTVDFEVELKINEGAEEDTTLISSCNHLYDSAYDLNVRQFRSATASSIFIRGCWCDAELSFEQFDTAVQATIVGVHVVEGGWPFKYGCRVTCSWSAATGNIGPTYREVVLLDYHGENMDVGSNGYLHLSRNVVPVELQGTLRLVIQAYPEAGCKPIESHVDFGVQHCQTSNLSCEVDNSTVEVTVAWSLLVKEKLDLLVEGYAAGRD